MVRKFLDAFGEATCRLLGETLPRIETDWWTRRVLDRLTFQQQSFVRSSGTKTLAGLDVAALMRVLDQNWHEIAPLRNLPPIARTWLKETQTIRNRWAHAPASGLAPDETYRDLDTMERLLAAIGASTATLDEIRKEKASLLQKLGGAGRPPAEESRAASSEGALRRGTLVRLKARPAVTGAVIDHLPGAPEDRYVVFHDGATTTYYASQLEPAEVPGSTARRVQLSELNATLTACQLLHPSTASLYSLYAARINFVPYQFRPVLKLIQSDRPRLLIADEVGVGKTIEAGLILKELQARREVRSVLVICPKPLVAERKWMEELKRFDEQFVHLDGDALRYCIEETHLDGVWPQQYSKAIVPYSLFDEVLLGGRQKGNKRQRGLLDLDPPPTFDLVIVDEAHHIRNTETWAYRSVRYFCDNAEAAVLMSATPIQLSDNDLFNLLHLVRPDVLPTRADFERMAEPNPHLNRAIELARRAQPGWEDEARACLQAALATPWGRTVLAPNPKVQETFDSLGSLGDEAARRLQFVRNLEETYTFSSYINRTRRRDIGSFTTRKPETVSVEFSPEQRALHDDLLVLIARIMEHRHGNVNLQFLLTTIRRQAASCIFGLAPMLEAILSRHLTALELSEAGDETTPDLIGDELADFRSEIEALIQRSRNLSRVDPKLEALRQVVRDKQKLPNNKLLLFSTFRHTLAYLLDSLGVESVRIGLIHGDIAEDERRVLRNRFGLAREHPEAIDLLMSSEVGCEGLDYQFCDGLVNYDLPWNPMRVEQRIGRIDRYGQRSETVVVYNFVTPGTVDADIYERCLWRIGVFREALGGSEEILGRLTRELRDVAENLTLTSEERAARLQQLADNEVRAVQEQARLEDEQSKLFGIAVPSRSFEDMVREASSYWLTPSMLANLVANYLEALAGGKEVPGIRDKKIVTLRLAREVREALLTDFREVDQSGATARAWERWLKSSDPYFTLTFDPVTADERRDIAFITPTHPLVRQAAKRFGPTGAIGSVIAVRANEVAAGRYPFAVYRWRKLGLKEDFAFQPVCSDPQIASRLLDLLGTASVADGDGPTRDQEKQLESVHYAAWSQARADHIEQVAQLAAARLASLRMTHEARVALLEEQRDQANDERIRRMRESQIDTARLDFERRSSELTDAPARADVVAEAIAFGVLVIEPSTAAG